ncbi:hypothetical protein GBAR_LOCUS14555, partial [Geodia barretti]
MWLEVTSNGEVIVSSNSTLIMRLNSSLKELQYRCQTTVDHDGNTFAVYAGTTIFVCMENEYLLLEYILGISSVIAYIIYTCIYNRRKCNSPLFVTLITTLSDCTSEGTIFTDEANDFSLEIPEGAIPEGEILTVDVGVTLFGPFQFP